MAPKASTQAFQVSSGQPGARRQVPQSAGGSVGVERLGADGPVGSLCVHELDEAAGLSPASRSG